MKTHVAALIALTALVASSLVRAQDGPADSRAEQLWQQAHLASNTQAFPLLAEAARLGHPQAQNALGNMYWHGEWGLPEDDALAAGWFGKAAAAGDAAAQFHLASMYTTGQGGLPVDLTKAAELLASSARQGFSAAQAALGNCFEFGVGVPRDRLQATYWLDLAAAAGDQTAAAVARFLKDPRTPRFQSEAQLGNYILVQERQPAFGDVNRCVPNPNWGLYSHSASGPVLLCR
jgi:TPR repeat protein